jgi:hypothetical protein
MRLGALIGFGSLHAQGQSLVYAEAMLLINDGQTQILEYDFVFKQGVSAYGDGGFAFGDIRK